MSERFMVDDAGTLIDVQTRDMFDIVEEVCPLLNILAEENEQLKTKNNAYIQDIEVFKEENQSLKFQLDECQNHKLFSRRELEKENEQLKKDLIDHSALISMLEDYQALKIEETLWNLTGAKSEEEFNELYEPYLEKAKRCWG